MCFIKAVYRPSHYHNVVIDPTRLSKGFISEEQHPFSSQNLKHIHGSKEKLAQNAYEKFLLTLLSSTLHKNSFLINDIAKEINQCQEKLDQLLNEEKQTQNQHQNSEKLMKQHLFETFISQPQSSVKQEFSQNTLTNKLFGEKKYKYKLTLEGDFSEIIYKERNIKVNLSLKNQNGKIIKNSNVVNLCFALADDNGKWISQNRVGDPMLKGKTEVELYHGLTEFNKIYTKDISRTFPNGRLNIVIYAKPSMLIYDGLTSEYEEHVDQNSVQPLILSNIVIKAKKKY